MNRRRFIAATGAAISAPLQSYAEEVYEVIDQLDDLSELPTAISGHSFRIRDREYKLADIAAPVAKEPDFSDLHLSANEAEYALQSLIAEGADEIREISEPDRWDRKIVIPAQFDEYGGKKTFQELLISEGAVWVQPQTDNHDFISILLRIEESARRMKMGLWNYDVIKVLNVDQAGDALNDYHLVEGVVLKSAQRRDYTYLNFGEDYKTDFTATVRSSTARKWKERGFDLLALEGEAVRIRGYIEWINGPSISLTHPLQIERLLRQT